MEVHAGGSVLRLLPQRALFLPQHHTLLVADAHIGKAVSFRRLGVPVPHGTTDETLARLADAISTTGARHVVFLGDLLHSARSHAAGTKAAVAAWRDRHARIELTLVRGNHDQHAGDPPPAWQVRCIDGPLLLDGLALAHHPQPLASRYVLAGHTHPAVVLGGRAHQHLRLPCFHFGADVGVLPAFGAFTGMHVVQRGTGDRVFVVCDDTVHALPVVAASNA
jgi:uncharacterized protein